MTACRDWGIDAADALQALAGASPSTVEPRAALAEIRHLVESAEATPATLDEMRKISPDIASKIDAYLDRHGAVIFSSYDIDSPTLAERPELLFTTILHATHDPGSLEREQTEARAHADRLKGVVPATAHAEFETMLGDARDAMDMRDDNGPITVEWPIGLVRLGLLEAGRRLAATGRLHEVEHVFELNVDEAKAIMTGVDTPSAEALADRADERSAQRQLDPPETLGPAATDPPIHLLPPAMARALDTTMAITAALGMIGAQTHESMSGTGIGSQPITARARIAETAEQAIAELEPGEVLVTRATSPAFNLVLTLVGGLVTVDGGPMSHAAVLSRELGLSAVIGVHDCLEHLSSGDVIELDPVQGTVRRIESSEAS